MKKLNCLVVDDEPLALEVIAKNISKVQGLNLIAKCKNAVTAQKEMQSNNIDLIFLDIQMPGITGVDFAKTLPKEVMIIFTTAYDKYALEGFNLNAIDYLLKPIEFERFEKACAKAFELFNLKNKPSEQDSFISVKSEYQVYKIKCSSILYVEGLKDYVKIFTNTQPKPILTRQNLKTFESQLNDLEFVRVHKSYIVSLNKIVSVTKSSLTINNNEIPLGEKYREDFTKKYFNSSQ